MDSRARATRAHVPGAFPMTPNTMSRAGSSQSSTSSIPTPLSSPSRQDGSTSDLQAQHTPVTSPASSPAPQSKKGGGAVKGRRTLGCSPVNGQPSSPNEFGVVVVPSPGDDETVTVRAKGKTKAVENGNCAGSPTARLVSTKPGGSGTSSASAPRKGHCVELSSDSDCGARLESLAVLNLKREVAQLKKQLENARMHQKSPGKVANNDNSSELKRVREHLAQEKAQVKALREREAEFRESVRAGLLCGICDELLHQPWALSPCGHVYCLPCLQSWFNPQKDDDDDEDDDHSGPKTCPDCRARIRSRPIQIFTIKSLAKVLEPQGPDPPAMANNDPWEGVFSESDDDDEGSETDSEGSGSEAYGSHEDEIECICEEGEEGWDEEGICRFCGRRGAGFSDALDDPSRIADEYEVAEDDRGSSTHSEDEAVHWEDGEERNTRWNIRGWNAYRPTDVDIIVEEDEDEDDRSSARSHSAETWIMPQPAPACLDLDANYNLHLTSAELELCNRGVPFDMIGKYRMSYEEEQGICARAGNWTLWLGWNLLDIQDTDVDGARLIDAAIRDIRRGTDEWRVPRQGGAGGRTAWRLIRRGGLEDWGYPERTS